MEDKQFFSILKSEQQRQREQLQMIPSENYASKNVLNAVGSVFINKYSEGQIGKRYYQGNKNVDELEKLTKERALKFFDLSPEEWGVNVQAVTGSVANLAVYNALLQPGDKIMGMFLYHGGHLSHGWKLPDGKKVSFTSVIYDTYSYTLDEQKGVFDYDEVEKQVSKVKPKILVSGGTAYPRDLDHKRLGQIAKKVGAFYLADIAHEAGLVGAGVLSSPFEYADVVTMTTRKTLRGPIGTIILSKKEYSEAIDYNVFPRLQGGPPNHQIAGICVALGEALTPEFEQYAKQVVKNAKALASNLTNYGHKITSGGTDKHLMLLDFTEKEYKGTEAALALEKANVITNKNTIPNETGKPWNPSGLRLGTPAITSRGMVEEDMKIVANFINQVLTNINNEKAIKKVGDQVKDFALKYKVPGLD